MLMLFRPAVVTFRLQNAAPGLSDLRLRTEEQVTRQGAHGFRYSQHILSLLNAPAGCPAMPSGRLIKISGTPDRLCKESRC
jgi:hypothetical protein